MSNELLLPELFAHQEDFLRLSVNISAVLVIRGGECYLVPSLDSYDAAQRVEIFAPSLEKKLDASVGGWVGGVASYFDKVKIVGILRNGTTRRNLLSISDVSLVVLYRDEEIYEIKL